MSLLKQILTIDSAKELLGFDDRKLMLIGIPFLSVWVSFLLFGNNVPVVLENRFIDNCLVSSFMHVLIYWLSIRAAIIFFRKKYPFKNNIRKRLFTQSIFLLVVYIVVKNLSSILLNQIPYLKIDEPVFELSHVVANLISLTLAALVFTVYEGNYFYSLLNKSIIEKEQLERKNIESQLEGLKNQVNPHFLFNSLNTLSYIIPEDQEVAVSFVHKLSKVYRYILEIRDKKLIALSEELNFVHAYVFLLKERFGENLKVEIDIPKKYYNHKLVPLSLQILFENVIKHNIISASKPLTIEVFMEGEKKLVVKNNLQRKNQVVSSTKMGLQNIKNRYQFFSEEKVKVITTSDSFIVVLPLLKIKNVVNVG